MSAKPAPYTDEQIKMIAASIEQGMGYKALARTYGVNTTTAKTWIARYQAYGPEQFLSSTSSRVRYDEKTKEEAAKAVLSGEMTRYEAMARFGVRNEKTLAIWCKRYREAHEENARPPESQRQEMNPAGWPELLGPLVPADHPRVTVNKPTGTRSTNTYDTVTKRAAARSHLEGGMTNNQVQAYYGIRCVSSLIGWYKIYKEKGPDALV